MSWLFTSFQSDDPDSSHSHFSSSPEHSPSTTPPALTHDLSLLAQTIATRFRGVAEFLAPLPAIPTTLTSSVDSSHAPSSSQSLLGSFRTGLSLLSSNKAIVESRDALLHKLQKNAQVENGNRKTLDKSQDGCMAGEPQWKNVLSEEEVSTDIISAGVEMDYEQNTEKRKEDEPINTGTSLRAQKKLEHKEDISFSDLEEDDNDLSNRLSGINSAEETKVSSPRGCNDGVQLKGSSPEFLVGGGQQRAVQSSSRDQDSEGEESNDWLTVDDFD